MRCGIAILLHPVVCGRDQLLLVDQHCSHWHLSFGCALPTQHKKGASCEHKEMRGCIHLCPPAAPAPQLVASSCCQSRPAPDSPQDCLQRTMQAKRASSKIGHTTGFHLWQDIDVLSQLAKRAVFWPVYVEIMRPALGIPKLPHLVECKLNNNKTAPLRTHAPPGRYTGLTAELVASSCVTGPARMLESILSVTPLYDPFGTKLCRDKGSGSSQRLASLPPLYNR